MKRFVILFIACANIIACGEKTESKPEENADPLSFTVYSEKTELFVEFQPMVVGKLTNFAAHFTILGENFMPLSAGDVTVSLIVNGKEVKQTATSPSRPGIYKLALTPQIAGTGTLVFDINTKSYKDRLVIENVVVYSDEKSIPEAAESAADAISFLKEQAWNIEFANTVVTKQTFNDVIVTSGQISSAPGDEVIVTAGTGGIVSFAQKGNTVGSSVAAGTSLFKIAGGNLAENNINARVSEARSNLSKAKTDYNRGLDLVKDQIISQRDFEEIKRNYQNAQTYYNTVSQNYSSKGQNIKAPISGFIKNILVSEGQFVESGTPLATVSKNQRLLLMANVSQKHFDKLSSIRSANFKTGDKIISTEELNGKVVSFGKSAGTASPFIPLAFELDNDGSLLSGSIVEVYLKSAPITDALVIPTTALMEEQGVLYVYVQTAGESFEKREVKTGANDGNNVQILSGLAEHERVVSKGAYQIKLSAASGTLPEHGHEH